MKPATVISQRPELTLPDKEAALLREHYKRAGSILEYGAGGSTVMASEMADKHIMTVETDQAWVAAMEAWFADHPGKSPVDLIWANIGKTKAWGRPANEEGWRDYAKYPLEIWSLEGIPHPEIVLVDGRFRVGCILATAFRCSQPVTVLVDDYARRASYHVVEELIGAPKMTGRMAEFTVTPTPIPSDRLLDIISYMQDPY